MLRICDGGHRGRSFRREFVTRMGTKRSTATLLSLTILWGVFVGFGFRGLWAYESRPGAAATPPLQWPAASSIQRVEGTPTLVMLAHPHCPCTRASIEELNRIMAHAGDG